MLSCLKGHDFERILVLGHPGKLVKLAVGHWDTHSSRSPTPVSILTDLGERLFGRPLSKSTTAEGFFAILPAQERQELATTVARRVRMAVAQRLGVSTPVATVLIDMKGHFLGYDGDLTPWESIGERS